MARTSLTDTQLVILSSAAQREDFRIELPERLHGGAAKAVLSTLLSKSLIEPLPRDANDTDALESTDEVVGYRISRNALAALGIESDPMEDAEQPTEADGADPLRSDPNEPDAPATAAQALTSSPPRAGTKLANVIALLEYEGGASINELTAATGWLAHTTRAALTGLRKRGLIVERAKREDGTTIYRIVAEGADATAGEAS